MEGASRPWLGALPLHEEVPRSLALPRSVPPPRPTTKALKRENAALPQHALFLKVDCKIESRAAQMLAIASRASKPTHADLTHGSRIAERHATNTTPYVFASASVFCVVLICRRGA